VPRHRQAARLCGHSQDLAAAAALCHLRHLLRPPHPPLRPVGLLVGPHRRRQLPRGVQLATAQWLLPRCRPTSPHLYHRGNRLGRAPRKRPQRRLLRLISAAPPVARPISCRRRRCRFQRLLRVMSVDPPADRPIGCRRRRFYFQRLPTPQGGVGGFALTGGWVSSWIPTNMQVGGQWRFRWRDRSTE